jgi:hypothetical protein
MPTESEVSDASSAPATRGREISGGSRFLSGLGWGIVATVAMSIPMIAGAVAGFLPMPRPIPAAIVGTILGQALPQPALMVLAAGSHLAYGGVAGGILAMLTRPVTVVKGLGWGVLLWAVMGVAWLPFLGWGIFGTGISPRVTVATFVLHLIFGVTLGWLTDRR